MLYTALFATSAESNKKEEKKKKKIHN